MTWRHAVFVDTSAFAALASIVDQDHDAAKAIQARLVRERLPLVTTNWILAETHALLLGRVGRHRALRVLLTIDRSDIAIVRVSENDELQARHILERYDDKDFSLTDATSFALMERLGMTRAFTFDRHFAQYGFLPALPISPDQ
jgi:predicted nucleic acid-binding protein